MLTLKQLVFRSWLYFRVGHGTYFAYIMGFVQWVLIFFTLYIRGSPFEVWFPKLSTFILIFTPSYAIVAVTVGYAHYKRSQAFTSEVEVGLEANPYTFQVVPDSKEHYLLGLQILQTETIRKIAEKEGVLTVESRKAFDDYESMLRHLQKLNDVRTFRKG